MVNTEPRGPPYSDINGHKYPNSMLYPLSPPDRTRVVRRVSVTEMESTIEGPAKGVRVYTPSEAKNHQVANAPPNNNGFTRELAYKEVALLLTSRGVRDMPFPVDSDPFSVKLEVSITYATQDRFYVVFNYPDHEATYLRRYVGEALKVLHRPEIWALPKDEELPLSEMIAKEGPLEQ